MAKGMLRASAFPVHPGKQPYHRLRAETHPGSQSCIRPSTALRLSLTPRWSRNRTDSSDSARWRLLRRIRRARYRNKIPRLHIPSTRTRQMHY